MTNSVPLISHRTQSASAIEQRIRTCDLSLAGIDEIRLDLAMQLAELDDLQRTISRRSAIFAKPGLRGARYARTAANPGTAAKPALLA